MGDNADDTPGTDPAPKFITDDQLTKRFRDFEKKQEKVLGDLSATVATQVTEAVAASLTKSPTEDPRAKDAIEDHPTVKGLQKQVAEMEEREKKARGDADRERSKARDSSLRQRLHDALVKGGLDAGRTRHAIALLVDGEKRVRWSDDEGETLVFRDTDNQDIDFTTGLRSWLKTDDAQLYMPPRGLSGSGDRIVPGTRPPEPGAKPAGSISRMLLQMADGVTPSKGEG